MFGNGWLEKKKEESGKQFSTKAELIEPIHWAWTLISLDYLKNLYESMPNGYTRLF